MSEAVVVLVPKGTRCCYTCGHYLRVACTTEAGVICCHSLHFEPEHPEAGDLWVARTSVSEPRKEDQ
jgi:hypothetical protein